MQFPRPFGDSPHAKSGWEPFTNSYPEYGRGGALQYKAGTRSFDDSWVYGLEDNFPRTSAAPKAAVSENASTASASAEPTGPKAPSSPLAGEEVPRVIAEPTAKTSPKPVAPTASAESAATSRSAQNKALSEALPPKMRSQVPVEVNPALEGRTVRVDYEKGGGGTTDNIRIEAGPHATPADIALHMRTVRLMQNWSGFSGRVQVLVSRLRTWVGLHGEPLPGPRAFELKHEIEKLPRIIAERRQALSEVGADDSARNALQKELRGLEAQLREHEQAFKTIESEPGKGSVAAEDRSVSPHEGGTEQKVSSATDGEATQHGEAIGHVGKQPSGSLSNRLSATYKEALERNPKLAQRIEQMKSLEANPKQSARAEKEAKKIEGDLVREGIHDNGLRYYPEV